MKSKQLYFFADKTDVLEILHQFEYDNQDIYYCLAGLFDDSIPEEVDSLITLQNLGIVNHGDWNHIDDYLILPKTNKPLIRVVPQYKGGNKYAIDQLMNTKSVIIKLGGVFKDSVLIGGKIGTISEEIFSLNTFSSFAKIIRKRFTKVGTFYVGKEALKKLREGWRLTTNIRSPSGYDLMEE